MESTTHDGQGSSQDCRVGGSGCQIIEFMEGPCVEIPKHCLSSLTKYFWRTHNGY
jgi:hypothetical protein